MSHPNPYLIEIRGRATDRVLRPVLDEFVIEPTDHGTTRLIGEIRDPSHLNGLLAHFTSMNVDVVELRRLDSTEPNPDTEPNSDTHPDPNPDTHHETDTTS